MSGNVAKQRTRNRKFLEKYKLQNRQILLAENITNGGSIAFTILEKLSPGPQIGAVHLTRVKLKAVAILSFDSKDNIATAFRKQHNEPMKWDRIVKPDFVESTIMSLEIRIGFFYGKARSFRNPNPRKIFKCLYANLHTNCINPG